jgi:hypothetical protein
MVTHAEMSGRYTLNCIVLESFELRVVSEEGFEFYAEGFSPLAFLGAEAIVLKCD